MSPRYLLVLPLLATLTACAPGGDGGGKDSQKIPNSLEFRLPPSQKLTEEEKTSFLQLMKDKQSHDLAKFLVIERDESFEDRQEREKELREASQTVRDTVTRAQRLCTIQQPQVEETQTGSGQNVVISKTEKASVSGADCPISASQSSSERTHVEKLTSMSPVRGLFRTVKNQTSTYRVLDQSLAQDLQMISQTAATKSDTLTDTTDGTFKTKSSIQMTAKAEYADGNPMSMTASLALLGRGDENMQMKSLQMVAHLTITYMEKTYVLSVQGAESNGKQTTMKAYLNGDPIDENAFKLPVK